MKLRRCKIVVTLGPSLSDRESILKVIKAGADVFRANFSHGSPEDHARNIAMIREVAESQSKEVAIFADLQGPKIRISRFKNNKILLKEGSKFILDVSLPVDDGDETQVGLDYKALVNDVSVGDTLLLDDGRLVFLVKAVNAPQIECEVIVGGELSNNKGINRLGGGLSAPALTEKDIADLKTAVNLQVDYIAVSFPRSAEDMKKAVKLIKEYGGKAGVIAKIERAEAVNLIDEIIEVSDAVMVARGDLGVEIGDAAVPGIQKHIIQRSRSLNKPVITATQMMESMIHNAIPTRAEVSDVANAVIDGTDAVMLSAETAVGDFPERAVAAMDRTCFSAEQHPGSSVSGHRLECQFELIDEAVAMATMYTANHLNIKAIIALTETGTTPLWMSRIRSSIPIYGFSRHESTRRKIALYRGVYPVSFDVTNVDAEAINYMAIETLKSQKILKNGDLAIITRGDLIGVHGRANTMQIISVGMHGGAK